MVEANQALARRRSFYKVEAVSHDNGELLQTIGVEETEL
jgi:hypothetical protein